MFNVNDQVRFLDLAVLETRARDGLVDIVNRLSSLKRPLVAAEKQQLELCKTILGLVGNGGTEVCDPLFVATRELLNSNSLITPPLLSEQDGQLFFGTDSQTPADATATSITQVALVLGILAVDGATPPPVKVRKSNATASRIAPDANDALMNPFTREFYAAVGEANAYGDLAEKVLALLCIEGDSDGSDGENPGVVTTEFARVMRGLLARGISTDEPQLRRRVNEELNTVQNVGTEDSVADGGIDLPNLEDLEDANIVSENVRVMGPMIVAAMFDELKAFQVVDRIVEQFQHGTLPIGPGNAGKLLYRYWRETPNRISEQERKNFAAITLGIPGGDPNTAVNREFNDLWIRFVSSVSSFVRQTEVDALLRATVPNPINHQQVRKAARDLAGNLSLHGYGMAHYAAREIQSQVKFMIELLQDPEIRGCYASKDMWQVIDQVATYELGGARTSSRYRTLATCGTIITAWLANNVARINKATGPLLNIDQIANPDVSSNHKSTVDPTDYDLVNACELWLADTATSDTQIEQFSQPREAPQMTSKPVQIPQMAREMLDGIGDIGGSIGLGTGIPVKAGNGIGSNNGASYYTNRRH
ncbi:hypothetical protein [Dyella subtropica]|uniref:hypothetical protein n=1 Tax=Dyella subtropica TaxID=2992127 RepID=UPI0022505CB8|nr:hypothetical protein [Dyella subtropica]